MKWNLLFVVLVFCEIYNFTFADESHRLLSRKKRWLIFPEGSSLQVVHFTAIPVHGLPTVFLIGVTGAIGYELPFYPLSDIAEEIGERIKNGTFELRRDKDVTKVQYVDRPYNNYNKHKYYYTQPDQYYYQPHFNGTYNWGHPAGIAGLKSFWNELQHRVNKFAHNNRDVYYSLRDKTRYLSNRVKGLLNGNKPQIQRKRFKLLPILMKRSIEEQQRKFNSTFFHEKYQMQPMESRQLLYSRIETFLNGKGMNGRECILKTLCQVRSSEHSNSFMSEIMKTVFKTPSHQPEMMRDFEYHHDASEEFQDCSRLYKNCQYNLWDHHLLKM
ncbi:hypothetical protein DMENIID0001_064060 [Sergentomyia squamirostris]